MNLNEFNHPTEVAGNEPSTTLTTRDISSINTTTMSAAISGTAAQASFKDITKKESESTVVYVIVFLGLIYGFFFLPEPVLALFKSRFGEIGKIGGTLAGMGFSAMVAYLIGTVIMSQDILATTNLPAGNFFQGQYPSKEIMAKLQCGQPQADYLWFNLFNPWSESGHHRHMSYRFTFQRSYSCRLIFHARMSFVFFTMLASLTWVISWRSQFENTLPAEIYSRGLLIFIALVIIAILFGFNRTGKPTGCWKRFEEINNINKAWLNEAVFKKDDGSANSYEAALALLQDANWRKKWGYKKIE